MGEPLNRAPRHAADRVGDTRPRSHGREPRGAGEPTHGLGREHRGLLVAGVDESQPARLLRGMSGPAPPRRADRPPTAASYTGKMCAPESVKSVDTPATRAASTTC